LVAGAVAVAEQAETVRPALEGMGTPAAMTMAAKIAFACAAVSLVAAIYTAIRRVKDHFERGI
ncbi:MAG: hypothetical protein ABL897_16120, partial [Hyphomicrobium sp.]